MLLSNFSFLFHSGIAKPHHLQMIDCILKQSTCNNDKGRGVRELLLFLSCKPSTSNLFPLESLTQHPLPLPFFLNHEKWVTYLFFHFSSPPLPRSLFNSHFPLHSKKNRERRGVLYKNFIYLFYILPLCCFTRQAGKKSVISLTPVLFTFVSLSHHLYISYHVTSEQIYT